MDATDPEFDLPDWCYWTFLLLIVVGAVWQLI